MEYTGVTYLENEIITVLTPNSWLIFTSPKFSLLSFFDNFSYFVLLLLYFMIYCSPLLQEYALKLKVTYSTEHRLPCSLTDNKMATHLRGRNVRCLIFLLQCSFQSCVHYFDFFSFILLKLHSKNQLIP